MRNFSDDELKKWLSEEYNKEIDEMEKIMFPDGNIPDDGETEEEARAAYARLVERLKADGIYEEENDSENADDHRETDKKTEEPEKVKIVYLPAKPKKINRIARAAAVVLVCAAGVFAASMTSQANRSYFIDSVKLWTGNDTSISVDNDETNDGLDSDEAERIAIDNIKNVFDTSLVPIFMYRPSGFKFKNYKVNKDAGYAWLEYNYNNTVVSLYMNNYTDNSKSSNHLLDGKLVETVKKEDDGIEIEIIKIKGKKDEKDNYAAYWEKEGIFYQVSGKMKERLIICVFDREKDVYMSYYL